MRKGAQAGTRTHRRTGARVHRRTGALAHWRNGALAAKPLIYTLLPVFPLYNIPVVII